MGDWALPDRTAQALGRVALPVRAGSAGSLPVGVGVGDSATHLQVQGFVATQVFHVPFTGR